MNTDPILTQLGTQLRSQRLERGLTQADLALRAGLPRLKVVQIEAGRATVSAGAYARVAQALGFDLASVPKRRPTLDDMGEFLK